MVLCRERWPSKQIQPNLSLQVPVEFQSMTEVPPLDATVAQRLTLVVTDGALFESSGGMEEFQAIDVLSKDAMLNAQLFELPYLIVMSASFVVGVTMNLLVPGSPEQL